LQHKQKQSLQPGDISQSSKEELELQLE